MNNKLSTFYSFIYSYLYGVFPASGLLMDCHPAVREHINLLVNGLVADYRQVQWSDTVVGVNPAYDLNPVLLPNAPAGGDRASFCHALLQQIANDPAANPNAQPNVPPADNGKLTGANTWFGSRSWRGFSGV